MTRTNNTSLFYKIVISVLLEGEKKREGEARLTCREKISKAWMKKPFKDSVRVQCVGWCECARVDIGRGMERGRGRD